MEQGNISPLSQLSTSLSEGLHWLARVMDRCVKSRERQKFVDVLPQKFKWLSQCTKPQTSSVLIKLLLDEPSSNGKIFYWPTQCGCNIACDFCIVGNSAAAISALQTLANEQQYDINYVAWWKRHMRFTSPRSFLAAAGAKTFYCFVFLEKPEFFVCNADCAAMVVTEPVSEADTDVATVVTGDDSVHNTQSVNDAREDRDAAAVKKARREYRCNICRLPKRGHSCRGIAPPPLPVEEPLLQPPPIPPPITAPSAAALMAVPISVQNDTSFESVFVPEDVGKTRLERVFKSGANNTSTAIGWRNVEPLNTDIDL